MTDCSHLSKLDRAALVRLLQDGIKEPTSSLDPGGVASPRVDLLGYQARPARSSGTGTSSSDPSIDLIASGMYRKCLHQRKSLVIPCGSLMSPRTETSIDRKPPKTGAGGCGSDMSTARERTRGETQVLREARRGGDRCLSRARRRRGYSRRREQAVPTGTGPSVETSYLGQEEGHTNWRSKRSKA